MARARYEYIERKKAEGGASGTATYDLPESGYIPLIIVRAYSTPTASTDGALPLNKAITKIEIVDGGKVIQSLSANQLLGAYMHRKTRKRVSTEVNDNAVEGHEDIPIVLGGIFNRTNYAPDFSKFTNPQIKISWDYSQTTGEFGATYDADTSPVMKFSVIAKIISEGGAYTHGYVKSSEIKTWTQATSTETKIDIPIGDPLIGIMIEAGYDALDWTEDIEELELSFNNGEWIPLHLYEDEVATFEEWCYGEPAEVSWMQDTIDAVEFDMHMGYITHIDGTSLSSAGRVFEYDGTHKGIEAVGFMDAATPTAISSYEQVYIHVEGYMPYQCLYIPASYLLDSTADTIDTNAYRTIVLKCTSGGSASTSSTPAVVAEYLITR